MAITTLDGAISGAQPMVPFLKTGVAMAAVGGMRAYNPRYVAGNPGAATAPGAGINGTAVTGPGSQIIRANPATGNAYVMGVDMAASTTGTLWLIDRLWENSGLSPTLTTAQAITPAALPSRDRTGTANGVDVMAAIEWSATGGAGTPTVTLTYTDQTGTTGKTATISPAVTAPPAGTFEIFMPSAANGGIRAPTSLIQSATRTSGTMHLVLFRKLAVVPCPIANVAATVDFLTGCAQRVYNDSCLEYLWFPASTSATVFFGGYTETQG